MNGYDIAINQIKEKYDLVPDTYIVHLKYKYSFETTYCNEYEVVEYFDGGCCWFNDWCEGQTDIIVLGILAFREIPPTVFYYITEH